MNDIPLIALCVSSVLSVAAIVISALSLRNSWRAQRSSEDVQHHNQIVSFEQRRQDVREIFLEGQLIAGERSDELNRAILISENQLIVGKMSEQLKRKFLEATKIVRDGVAHNAVVRHEYETVLERLDRIPPTPSTQARLDLEGLRGAAIRMKNEQQALLEKMRNAIQSLEDTLEGFQRPTSK
jgi:hypothetical protein